MAMFDMTGNYELRFRERTGQKFRSMIQASDDADALGLARQTRYPGLSLEVWQKNRLVTRFPEMPTKQERQSH